MWAHEATRWTLLRWSVRAGGVRVVLAVLASIRAVDFMWRRPSRSLPDPHLWAVPFLVAAAASMLSAWAVLRPVRRRRLNVASSAVVAGVWWLFGMDLAASPGPILDNVASAAASIAVAVLVAWNWGRAPLEMSLQDRVR